MQLFWWDQLVQVTGGTLNPTKCCSMVYHWGLDKRGILKLCTPNVPPLPITLIHRDTEQDVCFMKTSAGTLYLGLYLTTDSNTTAMETHLLNKVTLYMKAFHHMPMDRREAGVLYCLCFILALAYPLPATWLLDTFFAKVQQMSTSTILNKMGYHCNLPRTMVFVPQSIGGVGLCNLQQEMEVQQILILLQHMRSNTPLGHTMEILTCQCQLWAGIQQLIFVDSRPCP